MEYSSIFNKDSYSLLFKNNVVKKLYKNQLIENACCEDKNIQLILNKFINKDLSVRNDCINIPIYINKLFEIICNKENNSCHKVLHDIIFNEILNNIREMEKASLKNINDFINTHDVIILDKKDNTLLRYIIVNFNSITNFYSYCYISKIYIMYRFYNFLVKNRFYIDDLEKFKLEKLNENNKFDIEEFKLLTLNKINDIKLDIERHYKHLIIYNEINKVFDEILKN